VTSGHPYRRALVIAAAFVLPIVVMAPLGVFLENTGEFSASLASVAASLVLLSVPLLAVLFLAGIVLPRVVLPVVAALAVIAFLESTLFFPLAAHRPFAGTPIDWSQWRVLPFAELAMVATVAGLAVRWRHRVDVLATVSAIVLVVRTLGLGAAWVMNRTAVAAHTARVADSYFAQFPRLSRQRNVIHLVPDATQGAMVHDLIRSDFARYSQVFDGFTLFTQAMGRYPTTYPSVSYLMTGRAPSPKRDYTASQPFRGSDIRGVLRSHSIVAALGGKGFRTYGYQCSEVYCAEVYTACTSGDVFDGRTIEPSGTNAAVRRLIDVALFQVTPIPVRKHVYDEGNWLLRNRGRPNRTYSAILDEFRSRITTDAPAGTYNYFHMAGAHVPLQFDEHCRYVGEQPITAANQRRQVTCTLAQVERLIESLKQAGVYDQTMIVVNSDHGTPGLPPALGAAAGPTFDQLMGLASALLLIKPMQARGPLTVSTLEASIGDIHATIADALSIRHDSPGRPLFRSDRSPRDREFLTYDEGDRVSGLQALPNLRRYRVRGDLFDVRSWRRPERPDDGSTPSALWVDDEAFERLAAGFGVLEVQGKPGRWVVGRHARVSLAFPASRKVRFVLESFVPPSIAGQSVEVAVNGRPIGTLDERALAGSRHVMAIPSDVPRRKVNTIDLNVGRTVTPPGDSRALAMVVAYVGLEPAR